jgi:hypothetical protein
MSRTSRESPRRRHASIASRRLGVLAPLALCVLCLGLNACASSSPTPEAAAAPKTAVVQSSELKTVRLLVRCLRAQGFTLPEPKRPGLVDLRGFNPNEPGYRAAVAVCLKRVPPPKGQ